MKSLAYHLIIVLSLTLSFSCSSSNDTASETEKQNPNMNNLWQKTAVKDIFGDETDSAYYSYRCKVKLPTGIRGGSLDAVIKVPLDFKQFYVVINPDSCDNSSISYGDYLILHYKPQGDKVSVVKLVYTTQGYKTSPDYNIIGNMRFINNQEVWAKNHISVKFKGFTSDNPNAGKFEDSPYGIDRDDADVYLNPEFAIQY